jgi:hypothetical protein
VFGIILLEEQLRDSILLEGFRQSLLPREQSLFDLCTPDFTPESSITNPIAIRCNAND